MAATVLAAATTVGLLPTTAAPSAGPLGVSNGEMWGSVPMRAHHSLTWGQPTVFNHTDHAVIIDKVTIYTNTPGMIKRVVAAAPKFDVGAGRGWPAEQVTPGEFQRVQGYVILPHGEMNIISKIVTPGVGVYTAGPIMLDYHIGDTHYRKTTMEAITACTLPDPNGKNAKACIPPFPSPGKSSVVIG